ncbi:MAG: hypothetical protein ABIG61_09445 [Planctomycetota bacterium]
MLGIYKGLVYINMTLIVVALCFAFTWHNRKGGKGFLCSFLLLTLLASVVFQITSLLRSNGIIEWSSSAWMALNLIVAIMYMVSNALLLAFVVVIRKFGRSYN